MPAEINVNLNTYCDMGNRCTHDHKPVLLPCPLPRSATFRVVLGSCRCPKDGVYIGLGASHVIDCPARSIRVFCSISGATWEESTVDPLSIETRDVRLGLAQAQGICRERWALVKALVLGHGCTCGKSRIVNGCWEHSVTCPTHSFPAALIAQRDVVYAALADMARAEEVHAAKSKALFETLKAADPEREHVEGPQAYAIGWGDGCPNAEAGLDAYVPMLVEQVGVLP